MKVSEQTSLRFSSNECPVHLSKNLFIIPICETRCRKKSKTLDCVQPAAAFRHAACCYGATFCITDAVGSQQAALPKAAAGCTQSKVPAPHK